MAYSLEAAGTSVDLIHAELSSLPGDKARPALVPFVDHLLFMQQG